MSLGSETRTRPQNLTYVKGVVAEAETSAKRSKLKNKPFGEMSVFLGKLWKYVNTKNSNIKRVKLSV